MGEHYLALASPCVDSVEKLCSAVCQESEGESEGAREGTWDRVVERKPASCRQMGGAVGVAAEEVSDDPL